jgi:alkylation response protein AidB-like acyl-CoA dehydrogenase
MRWQLSEEQVAYQEAFVDWLGSVASPEVVRTWLESGDRVSFREAFVATGWAGVGVSEEHGGQGGGLLELALTAEALGGAVAPSADWLASSLASAAVGHSDEAVAVLIPSDRIPSAAAVVSVDGDGRVSGSVPGVLGAEQASRFLVIGAGANGAELRSIEATAVGISLQPLALLDRSRSAARVTLDAVASEPMEADPAEFASLIAARAAVLVAADSLGAMQRMLDLAVEYSKQRKQFGVPIGSFQAVKHAAATILVDIEAARSALYYTAASVEDRQAGYELHAAAVKAQATAAGVRAADSALTLFGAIGYTWEHDLHHSYKRAKLNQTLFGSPARWNDRIADSLGLVPA